MKRLLATAAALVLAVSSPALAATDSESFSASASVGGALSMDIVLREGDFSGPIVTAMDFGELIEVTFPNPTPPPAEFKELRGSKGFAAFVTVNSHGVPYVVTQTGAAMTGPGGTLPAGACTVVPVYAPEDNGGAANPGALGTPGTWVAAGKMLYTSEPAGSLKTIQAHYGITGMDPAAGGTEVVPLDQPAGPYGPATITITATT